MAVIDLGTEFALNEQPERPSEVHVFTGKVQLEFDRTNQPMRELVAGEGAQVESDDQVRQMPANAAEFVSAGELQQREAAELQARYHEWKSASRLFAADPAMLVYFNFEEPNQENAGLLNHAPSPVPGTAGTIVGCNPADGRWPGKGALRFVNRGDRVRLKVPGAFDSLTYAAWVCIDNLSRPNNALAMSQRFKPGDVRWEISNAGSLRFGLQTGDTNWTVTTGPRAFKSKFGQWVHLAAVYDGPAKNVSLYLNGKQVASKGRHESRAAHPGRPRAGQLEPAVEPAAH
jgi:hypothetical protein